MTQDYGKRIDVVGPCVCGSWPGGKCLKCPWVEQAEKRKPVAWMMTNAVGKPYFRKKPQDKVFNPQPVYTAPLAREWVGLTAEDYDSMRPRVPYIVNDFSFADASAIVEAKLKEKNNG